MSRRASESPNAADDGLFSAVFELIFVLSNLKNFPAKFKNCKYKINLFLKYQTLANQFY